MPVELRIGAVTDAAQRDAAQEWLARSLGKKAPGTAAWNADVPEERIPVPDFGAVMVLRDHASALEGLEGIEEALTRTRFRHLPVYPWHLWLPVDFAEPLFPLIEVKIGPVYLGSALRLRAEIAEIRALAAKKKIAAPPPAAQAMEMLDAAAAKAIERKTALRGFAG